MQEAPPEALPVWLQTILYLGGVLGAFAAAWKGWISKAKPSEAPNAIVAGDIMSTKPMKDLADAVGQLNLLLQRIESGQHRIADSISRQTDAERSTEQAIRDLCRDQSHGIERVIDAVRSNRPAA